MDDVGFIETLIINFMKNQRHGIKKDYLKCFMKVIRDNVGFIEMLKEKNWRKNALTNVVKGLTIDTCYCPDIHKWETGIKKRGRWIIVKEYSSKKEAVEGHKKWVRKLRKNPEMKLKNCRTAIKKKYSYGVEER